MEQIREEQERNKTYIEFDIDELERFNRMSIGDYSQILVGGMKNDAFAPVRPFFVTSGSSGGFFINPIGSGPPKPSKPEKETEE
jgi:hypothetical protein